MPRSLSLYSSDKSRDTGGGGGGVGSPAVQIALAQGARVYATGSAINRRYIENLPRHRPRQTRHYHIELTKPSASRQLRVDTH